MACWREINVFNQQALELAGIILFADLPVNGESKKKDFNFDLRVLASDPYI